MTFSPIKMDGKEYRIRVVYDSMYLSFELQEGDNAGKMLNWETYRDMKGTEYSHQMDVEPDPFFQEDFDAFFHAVSAPVASHRVELPYGQDTISYDAQIHSGRMKDGGKLAGKRRWHGLSILFVPIRPQRYPE